MIKLKKEFLMAQLGRIFIIVAIILSIVNAFYWKKNYIDGLSVIFAFLSLVMVLYASRNIRKEYANSPIGALNQQVAQSYLFNMVYKSTIQNNFESLPLAVEEEVKEKMPQISIDQLLKIYDYMLTIPKEINIFYYNLDSTNQNDLKNSEADIKAWIKSKYLWMDEESLDLSFQRFFNS